MSKVLVTGSAGFIGSNLCYYLVNAGHEVLGIDRLTLQSNRNWTIPLEQKYPDRMEFELCDLCNIGTVRRIFDEYDIKYIVHMAAESHVDRSIEDPSLFWRSNVIGTNNLFDAARYHNVKLIINQGSDECFGPKPEGESFETDMFAPTSPYACSKAAQYYVGKSYINTFDMPIISTFPSNCFGPRQYREKIIPKFIYNLYVLNKPVPLMKSTHFQRDWLAVDDLCSALYLLLHEGEPGEDYNIGADSHRSNKYVTHAILDALSKPKSKYIEIVPDRKAHDCRYAVNSDKIRSMGWLPTNNFDDYLRYTINWYKEHYNEQMLYPTGW